MKTLLLTLLSPETAAEDYIVQNIKFPGEVGAFEVLPLHAPMIATLTEGTIVFTTDEDVEKKIHIKSGVMEVCNDKVSVCFEK